VVAATFEKPEYPLLQILDLVLLNRVENESQGGQEEQGRDLPDSYDYVDVQDDTPKSGAARYSASAIAIKNSTAHSSSSVMVSPGHPGPKNLRQADSRGWP